MSKIKIFYELTIEKTNNISFEYILFNERNCREKLFHRYIVRCMILIRDNLTKLFLR